MALLPQFVDGQVLTAAQLNAIVAKLNQAELVSHIPEPHFQRRDVSGNNNTATWYFSFLHQPNYNKLYYRTEWTTLSGGPSWQWTVYRPTVGAETAPASTVFNPPFVTGLNGGYLDISPAGLNGATLPVGSLYTLKVYIQLKNTANFHIDWLYEGS